MTHGFRLRLGALAVGFACALLLSGGGAWAATRQEANRQHRPPAKSYRTLQRQLNRCVKRHPGHCARQRAALKRARRPRPRHTVRTRPRPRLVRTAAATDIGGVPQLEVKGHTLTWNTTDPHNSYEFVEKVPGRPDRYTSVTGTSLTPAPVPGKIVSFSVRAADSANGWADEVTIGYPASGGSHPARAASAYPFSVGLVAGSELDAQIGYMQLVGARTARLEFSIDTPVSVIAPIVASYADSGIRPLLLASFNGRLPTPAEAENLGTWAGELGPGGSYWSAADDPGAAAVTDIEFGNETSDSYQFNNNSPSAYADRARTYALRVRTAANAIRAANPHVGVLAIADNSQQGDTWVNQMFKAVPNLSHLVAGWTVHPYGPQWAAKIRDTIASTAAAGGPVRVPIWVTEWGLATDNGRCLSDNYGFGRCMSYGQAAQTLQAVLNGMRTRFGGRIGAFYLFQASDQQASGDSSNRESYFGALQSDGSAKGAYSTAVEADMG